MDKIRRGNILWIDLGEHPGTHLQSGCRPCVVVSTDKANRSAKIYTVIPGTTKHEKEGFPVHCKVLSEEVQGYLNKATIFLAEQLCTVDEKQVICKMGHIKHDSKTMQKINQIITRQLSLDEEVLQGRRIR